MNGNRRHTIQGSGAPGNTNRGGRPDNDEKHISANFNGPWPHPPRGPRRANSKPFQPVSGSIVPDFNSSGPSRATGPNYAACMMSGRTSNAIRSHYDGYKSASYRHGGMRTNYTNGTGNNTHNGSNPNMIPLGSAQHKRLPASNVYLGKQTQHGRPMAQPAVPESRKERRKWEHIQRKQNNDWRVGDVVNFDMVKASRHVKPRLVIDPETLKESYEDKAHFYVPILDRVVDWEARFGVIVSIHRGDKQLVGTILPIYSYGGNGVKRQSDMFAIQHLAIVNRSEQHNLRGSANPRVPETHTLYVDGDDDFWPGMKNSTVVLSRPMPVYLDSRVRGPKATLETPSRDMLRRVSQMYNAIVSLDEENRKDFDCGEFQWLRAMLTPSANPAQMHELSTGSQQQAKFPAKNLPGSLNTQVAGLGKEVDDIIAAANVNSRKRKELPTTEFTPIEMAQRKMFYALRQRLIVDREMFRLYSLREDTVKEAAAAEWELVQLRKSQDQILPDSNADNPPKRRMLNKSESVAGKEQIVHEVVHSTKAQQDTQ